MTQLSGRLVDRGTRILGRGALREAGTGSGRTHVGAFVLLLLLAGVAGCRAGGGGRQTSGLPPGSLSLPKLPAQGLVDESRGGVALRNMRGRRLVWLPGFAVSPGGRAIAASAAYNLPRARPSEPVLHGPKGWYRLDVRRHALLPVTGGRLPLAHGAVVVARREGTFAVEQNGRVALRGSAGPLFRILSPQLVQSGTILLDLETRARRRLPNGCLAAGFHDGTLIFACGPRPGAQAAPLRLERMSPGGTARPLTQPLAQLIPETASLSPDGAWIAVEGDTGCAASYVYVAPARGGAARVVFGRSARDPFAANYSILLGWSADARLVVRFMPQHCDTPLGPQRPPNGVYLVDPRTLARTFVARAAVGLWNPDPRHG